MDFYHTNHNVSKEKLLQSNLEDLPLLFIEMYIQAIKKYHPKLSGSSSPTIYNLFTEDNLQEVYKKLKRFKYPIDYVQHR